MIPRPGRESLQNRHGLAPLLLSVPVLLVLALLVLLLVVGIGGIGRRRRRIVRWLGDDGAAWEDDLDQFVRPVSSPVMGVGGEPVSSRAE
jgi:hypothetical protein